MRTFSEFARDFHEWRSLNILPYNYDENAKYAWVLPMEAVEVWKHEIDDLCPEHLTEEEVKLYQDNFTKGGSIFGVYNVVQDDGITCRLYRMTENYLNFSFPNILCSFDGNLPLADSGIDLGTIHTNTLIRIKYGSINFSDTFDGTDKHDGYDLGIIMGKGFVLGSRNNNRLGQNSIFGSVNYTNGKIHLVRSHLENERKFVRYYELLRQTATSSSGGRGGQSVSLAEITPYDYITINGSLISLGNPTTLEYTFNIYEPDDDFYSFSLI